MGAVRQVWVDGSAGVAGDMILAALVDAGADVDRIRAIVDAVIPGAVRIKVSTVTRAGLRAAKVDVDVVIADPPHRTWRTVRGLLTAAPIPADVRDGALTVFSRLAAAEGHVHGVPADAVHFHEVGALDSIADVVGVCAALNDLGVDRVTAGEVAVGSGRVSAAHGALPVPVPAVIELARGWRVRAGGDGELATPTGMALVTALAAECAALPTLWVRNVGLGAGTKDTPGTANVVRVVLGDSAREDTTQPDGEQMVVLEANIDDMDPRVWPHVLAKLLEAGAADTWLTPIVMKKGRPAHVLSALCPPALTRSLREVMFRHTTTIGIRQSARRRYALPRIYGAVQVTGGSVAIKIAHRDGVIVRATPEFDDVAACATAAALPVGDVLQEAVAAASAAGLAPGALVPAGILLDAADDRGAADDIDDGTERHAGRR